MALNGKLFATLIERVVDNLNKGVIPEIQSTWEHVIESELHKNYENSLKIIDSSFKRLQYPLEVPDLLLMADVRFLIHY